MFRILKEDSLSKDNMKVAIISFYMMESTTPLAKHISELGVDIDLYSLLPESDQNTFIFDFLKNKQPNGFIDQNIVKKTIGKRLYEYLGKVKLKVFIYPTDKMSRLLLLHLYYAFKLSRHIKKQHYDLIHIIHISKTFSKYLYFFIDRNKVIQTLHEVTAHESKTPKYRINLMKTLIKNSTPIIFNSNISKQRFIEFSKKIRVRKYSERNFPVIRFGLFETYHCFSKAGMKANDEERINILNIGRIVPYKGIHFLIEAVKILQEKYPIHLIVAGKGEAYFDFKEIKSFEFINRSYSNEEVISLIEDCEMVVLPYTSGSQSGVPMTVFAFNKPIIASNIDAFKEVIDDGKTGLLVENLNAQTLAESIEVLLKDDRLKLIMRQNIKKKYSEGEYSWKSIAEKTILFYKRRVQTKNFKKDNVHGKLI